MNFSILVKRNDEVIGYLKPQSHKKDFDSKITGVVILTNEKYQQWRLNSENDSYSIFTDLGYMDSYENNTLGEELLLFKNKTDSGNQQFNIIDGTIYSLGRPLTIQNNTVINDLKIADLKSVKIGGEGLKNIKFEFTQFNPIDAMERVDEILSIYTFDFLNNKVKNIVKHAYSNGIYKDTFLIKSNSFSSDDNIKLSLKYRYPTYFGKIMYNYFDDSQLKKVLHYNTQDVNNKITGKIDIESRYGICGPVEGIDNTGNIRSDVWIIHVWGINLETTKTADYNYIVNNGKIIIQKYYERCLELYTTIREAAYNINKITDKKVKIIMPGVGQGAFLSSIQYKNTAINLHLEAIDNTFKKNNIYTVYYTDINKPLIKSGVTPWDNLFNIPKTNDEEIVLMVNAWDNRSFIGNGGSLDNSIDGYIVSGSGPGKNFLNSSYLHNVFFSTHLENENNWVKL